MITATRGGDLLVDVAVERLPALLADDAAHVWVDLSGPMDPAALHILRDLFRFHPLAIDDCFELREHPKVEGFDGYLYLIAHGLTAGSTAEAVNTVELDVFLGQRFLVTHHNAPSRSVAAVAEVASRNPEWLRRGPAVLLHAILEQQVDGIEPVLDGIEERVANLEDRVIKRPSDRDLATLMALRRSILRLRRWMYKQRDVMARIARNEFNIIASTETPLFRDIYDHLQRFTDLLESYRELTTSVQDAYLMVVGNRLNEIMKFLTIFTAVLLPLTVITGIYGMNFEHMPELRWRWGYFGVLGLMAVTLFGLLGYFKRRGWLGRDRIGKR